MISNRPKASKIYDWQICSTAPLTNTSEIQWHKMAITKVEQFLKSGISYHCKEKRKPVSTMLRWVWGTLRILSKLISKLNQNQICANNCNLSSGPYLTKVLRYKITILGTKSLTSLHLPLLLPSLMSFGMRNDHLVKTLGLANYGLSAPRFERPWFERPTSWF